MGTCFIMFSLIYFQSHSAPDDFKGNIFMSICTRHIFHVLHIILWRLFD